MRISDWSSDVCSSDLGAACRQLCLCCQDSVAGYSPNVFANAERAWDGGNSLIHILGILFSTLGSGVLCAGMAKHQSRLVGRKLPPSTVRLMKFGGFVVLALALAIDASGLGAAYGLIAWFGHLTVGAAVILIRLCSFNASGLRR